MKINKDRHIPSAAQIFGRTLVSGDIRFMRIFAGVLQKEDVKGSGSRVNAHLEHLFLAFENNGVKLNTDRPIL